MAGAGLWNGHLCADVLEPLVQAQRQLPVLARFGAGQVMLLAQIVAQVVKLFLAALVEADQLPVADPGDAVGRDLAAEPIVRVVPPISSLRSNSMRKSRWPERTRVAPSASLCKRLVK